jgi:hypothetical protein
MNEEFKRRSVVVDYENEIASDDLSESSFPIFFKAED